MYEGLKIIVVEDDGQVRRSVIQSLELAGLRVTGTDSAEAALRLVGPAFPGVVLTDVRLPGIDGLELLRRISAIDAGIPVIVVTGHGDISMAVDAMRLGAYDFIEKPFVTERLVDIVTRAMEKRALMMEVEDLRRQLTAKKGIEATLIGNSVAMQTLRAEIVNLADTAADVLIFGETGTGKELVARCLHDYSKRSGGNFVAINCGGLPESLFESEIFGHEAGAFTSAGKRRVGKIEYASGGTLMLDEIETMPMALQVKLLRAIQERMIERLGSNALVPVDCRVVAATKLDLKELSQQGKFRSDLYYRLSVAVLELPPLRERREDIPMLFEHFVTQAAIRHDRDAPIVPGPMLRALMAQDWPGNVRELRNVADRFVLQLNPRLGSSSTTVPEGPLSLADQVDAVEKSLIEQALKECGGRVQAACDTLGIAKKTLYDKIHKHGIAIDQFRIVDAQRYS